MTNYTLCECKSIFCSVLRRVYVGKIYCSIAKTLKFKLVNAGHVKARGGCKSDSFEHILWYSKRKLTNIPDYYCTILNHYLQLLAKVLQIRWLKNFAQLAGKYLCRSLFQSATSLLRDSDQDVFLGILGNCQEHHFYRALRNSCFCIYGTYL